MIKLPRLYVNGAFKRIIYPILVSITQSITPLDTASMTLPADENLPARSWVELFTPYGSAGMFRVRSPHDAYGQDTTSVELEHMISEVGDYRVHEEISEMLPANEAMQRVFKHYGGGKWKLGSVAALGSGKIACESKYDRVLDSMLAILEQKKDCMMAFDFTTKPWTVSIVKKGTTVAAEGRLARNVTAATISCDDTELCTRVWYQTFKQKNGTWQSKDASTKSKYGIIEGTVRTSSDMSAEEIEATVNAYLDDHKEPRYSVSIQGVELSQITGESLDKMVVGKLYRLNIPEKSVRQEMTITSIFFPDVYNAPRQMSVNLGAEEDTIVTFLHNLDAKGGGGGGGGKAKDKEEEAWSRYKTYYDKQDEYIAWMALEQDEQKSILNQAGMTLNSEGLLVYAKGKGTIGSEFEVTKEAIRLKADRVELDAFVKIKDLSANIAKIPTLTGQSALFSGNIASRSALIAPYIYLGGNELGNGVQYIRISGPTSDVYKLQYKTFRSDWQDAGSFSRATTLTGSWSGGIYKVTASPQGNTNSSGMLQNGDITKSGDYINLKVNSGETYTGKTLTFKWKDYLTSHSNCVAGLTRYNTDRTVELFRKVSETQYTSVGTYYWYRKSSNSALTTYYD